MLIPRFYEKEINRYLQPNKVVAIFGPRRVGKTTLVESFLKKTKFKYRYDSGENIRVQEVLSSSNFDKIFEYSCGYDLIVIDEAQRIPNVGLGLKILVDHVKGIRILTTGSSSFDLSGQIGEPLVGRKWTITLFPIAQLELKDQLNSFELKGKLPEFLVFGSYPEVLITKSKKRKIDFLNSIVDSYLLKDILELEKVKGAKILLDLLRLIAFQVGNEVSLRELASHLGLDYKTVQRYLDLFEKSFILFNLRGFSRNLRKEIYKKSKYYFYDNGIRNAIISNFNEIENRNDVGALWENFLVIERLKKQKYRHIVANNYFWRTWDKKEIDWVEEREGKLFGYELKWKKEKTKDIAEWKNSYPEAHYSLITSKNYLNFVT